MFDFTFVAVFFLILLFNVLIILIICKRFCLNVQTAQVQQNNVFNGNSRLHLPQSEMLVIMTESGNQSVNGQNNVSRDVPPNYEPPPSYECSSKNNSVINI